MSHNSHFGPHDKNHGNFWAITCFFNPMRYKRRIENYRRFREGLRPPLIAVELGYNDGYELDESCAEILVQLRGGDVLDQKERLLNLALGYLPEECECVAWLDCDILFERPDWTDSTIEALQHSPVVQPFSCVHYLEPAESTGAGQLPSNGFFRYGLAYLVDGGRAFGDVYNEDSFRRRPASASPGHAWAARRSVLDRHGFYDACIVGGADSAMNCAAYGDFERVAKYHRMNANQRAHYLKWARPYFETVRGRVSHVEGDLLHLWHGTIRDRRTEDNYASIQPFEFDPDVDLTIAEPGCWRWSSNKPILHGRVRDYFAGRNEDG